jgi:hypothetical protein
MLVVTYLKRTRQKPRVDENEAGQNCLRNKTI